MSWTKPHFCGEENHRFEPRYDSEPVPEMVVEARVDLNKLQDFLIKRTYVADVCIYCGKRSDRSSP